MKKIIALLFVLCMCFGLCACGTTKNETPETTEQKPIELTIENISQYLNIVIGEVVESTSEVNYYDTAPIEIYPLQAGDFSNVEIELSIKIDNEYVLKDAIGATLKTKETANSWPRTGTLTFKLPADGRYKIDVKVWNRNGWASNDDGIYACEVTRVSGTFTPNN